MKIVKLKMNAFLAYRDEVEIDFSQFEGLYLISGPTGSGKTAIFDAIIFALYGNPSGDRDTRSLRCDYASNKEETYVEMSFELKGVLYTVYRRPQYTRKGYKTPTPHKAILSYDDQVIEGVSEVNQCIEDILGINYKQFKQLVMISQGDFTKLIYAKSGEREEILGKIFETGYIDMMVEDLKQKVNESEKAYTHSCDHLELLINQLQGLKFNQFEEDVLKKIQLDLERTLKEIDDLSVKSKESEKEYESVLKEYNLIHDHNQKVDAYNKYVLEYKGLEDKKEEMDRLKDDLSKMDLIHRNLDLITHYDYISKEYRKDLKEKEKLEKDYNKVKANYINSEEDYQRLDQLDDDNEKLAIRIQEVKKEQEREKDYNRYLKEHEKLDQTLSEKNQSYKNIEKTIEKKNSRIDRDQLNVNRLPELTSQLMTLEKEADEATNRIKKLHDLSDLVTNYKNLEDRGFDLSDRVNGLKRKYRVADNEYRDESDRYFDNQAGIIARGLKEGMPCPVCGAIHHPHLAMADDDVLLIQEINLLREKSESIKEDLETAERQREGNDQQMKMVMGQIDSLKKELHIEEINKHTLTREMAYCEVLSKEKRDLYNKCNDEITYLNKLSNSIRKSQNQVKDQQEKLEKIGEEISELKEKKAILQGRIEENKGDYKTLGQRLKSLKKEKSDLEKTIDSIKYSYQVTESKKLTLETKLKEINQRTEKEKQEYDEFHKRYDRYINEYFNDEENFLSYYNNLNKQEEMENQYNDYIKDKERLSSQIELLESQLEDKDYREEKLVKTRLDDLKKVKEDDNNKLQTYNLRYINNKKIHEELSKEYERNQTLLTNYEKYVHLKDMTVGNNSMKLSFKRYVLSFYFENILQYANIQLALMSDERYQFVRRIEAKGNARAGLDLNIMDYSTGVERSVQTLSGGESFKAALSLALGLSSMIQSHVGGIELNTLFIDEGFGTLDEESLNQAIEVLMNLQTHNKTIGIISHVRELKEKIDHQIVINKGNQGSSLHIVNE